MGATVFVLANRGDLAQPWSALSLVAWAVGLAAYVVAVFGTVMVVLGLLGLLLGLWWTSTAARQSRSSRDW